MSSDRRPASRHERSGERRPARRPSRAEIRMRRAVAASGILTFIVVLAAVLESGSSKNTDKVAFDDGNVVRIDEADKTAEVDTNALGITNPGDASAMKAGTRITIKCVDFHLVRRLRAGDTLTGLATQETTVPDSQMPVSAVADSIAAFNNITAPDGSVSASFAQEGTAYEVPQLCSIDN